MRFSEEDAEMQESGVAFVSDCMGVSYGIVVLPLRGWHGVCFIEPRLLDEGIRLERGNGWHGANETTERS